MIADQKKINCVVDRKLITLFKQATSVCFHWSGSTSGGVDKGHVTLGRKRKPDGLWDQDGGETTIEIAMDGECHYFSGFSGARHRPNQVRCVLAITSAQHDEVWRSVIAILKCGDVLQMSWLGANNNQYVDNAGLFCDSLRLRVKRGDDYLFFHLGSGVCEDNSARMVRAG